MGIATSTAMLIGAALSAVGTLASMNQQKKAANAAREQQQRAAEEARALNQAAMNKAAAEAAARERDRNRARMGRASTVLTSMAGDTSTTNTATKTLLGS